MSNPDTKDELDERKLRSELYKLTELTGQRYQQFLDETTVYDGASWGGKLVDELIEKHLALISERERVAREETANWAVHYVDKVENDNPAPNDMWRTFKFIRNGLRDEFERVHGVDPAPTYNPSKAQLQGGDNE